jgi:flagellar biosynthesis/type III secretory pathway protein FliH
MNREIPFFIIIAYLSGAIFLVSLIELGLTVRRRSVNEQLKGAYKEIQKRYNQSINRLVLEDDSRLESVEKEAETLNAHLSEDKVAAEKEYKAQIDALMLESKKAVEAAQARAKRLEQSAKQEATQYLQDRQKEVEEELMNLVIAVAKKVLPEGISYETQKDVVMKALRDVQTKKNS